MELSSFDECTREWEGTPAKSTREGARVLLGTVACSPTRLAATAEDERWAGHQQHQREHQQGYNEGGWKGGPAV